MKIPDTIRLTVTRADIKEGQCREPDRCPIARALDRRKGVYAVSVGTTNASVRFIDANIVSSAHYILSPKAMDFVRRFDAGQAVKPAVFVLERSCAK